MKKLLIIGLTWPEPDSTAAGQRIVQLIQVFREANYAITFSSTAMETGHSADLKSLDIEKRCIQLNSAIFDDFVRELNPDIVLFDRFLTEEQFGWRVSENVPNALRILDTEDLHSLRHVREKAIKKGEEFTLEAWLRDEKTLRELASIYRSDLSIIISDYEMELLQKRVGIHPSLLLHLPFMVDALPEVPDWPSFRERKDFVFIGSGKHAPNLDAIHQLKTKIWPLIRKKLPEARLHIYGAYLPQQIIKMHKPEEGFWVQGRAEDIKNVMEKTRVCMAPLRFGAGIKGKLLHAMQHGTPSVTTSIGAEGMHGNLPWSGAIVNGQVDFAQAAILLYTNQNSWEKAQKAGIPLVNTMYAKDRSKNDLLGNIEELLLSLEHHRTQNIVGRVLQHQTLRSTKYLGKWIEAKNRKG